MPQIIRLEKVLTSIGEGEVSEKVGNRPPQQLSPLQ